MGAAPQEEATGLLLQAKGHEIRDHWKERAMKKKPGKGGKKCLESIGATITLEDAAHVTAEYLGVSLDEAILILMSGVMSGKLTPLPDLATEPAAGTA
jgi:hypothetical protein